MKFLLLIVLSLPAISDDRISEAKASILALIQPLMARSAKKPLGTKGKFRVDACEKQKLNWMDMLLQREGAEMEFEFKEGCDIQGKIKPNLFNKFPANLDLRHLENFHRLETENTILADLQVKPILTLEMRNGLLRGKSSVVKFEADYRVRIGATSEKMISDNLGGELRITEINGKKASIKEKILVK